MLPRGKSFSLTSLNPAFAETFDDGP
jgi:hypothetical protein